MRRLVYVLVIAIILYLLFIAMRRLGDTIIETVF